MRIEASASECTALLAILNESHAALERSITADNASSRYISQHIKLVMPLLGQIDKRGIVFSRYQHLITSL